MKNIFTLIVFVLLLQFSGDLFAKPTPNSNKFPFDLSNIKEPGNTNPPIGDQDVQLNKIDNDGDGYCESTDSCFGNNILPGDCDDDDVDINPKAFEECGDGIDNNCDDETDDFEIDDEGNTVYCKEQNCTDGKSDDMDDLVDCDDSDCATHSSCQTPALSEDELFFLSSEFKGSGCSLAVW